ncbi:MAG TPA: MBL fold metallo-hydrolase [Solirubrobacterales bacterium]|nr:MBL fold metallo-hydrolase [Solirubrobacterales bacterium]
MTEAARVTYVGHATVLVEMDGVRLLTDPVLRGRIGPLRRHGAPPDPRVVAEDVDTVLVSHLHHDHTDVPSLRRLSRTVPVLAAPGAGDFVERLGFGDVRELSPGESAGVGGVRVTATEADHPPSGRRFERASQAVGFELDGARRIYFAGDTDLFDGMEEIGRDGLDLALLPIWGWGTNIGAGHLNPERAARAAALLSAKLVIPIHWGTLYPFGLAQLRPGPLRSPPRQLAAWMGELAPQSELRVLAPGGATSLA